MGKSHAEPNLDGMPSAITAKLAELETQFMQNVMADEGRHHLLSPMLVNG